MSEFRQMKQKQFFQPHGSKEWIEVTGKVEVVGYDEPQPPAIDPMAAYCEGRIDPVRDQAIVRDAISAVRNGFSKAWNPHPIGSKERDDWNFYYDYEKSRRDSSRA